MSTMELLTVRETSDLLRVSPVTVRRYIAARKLPAVRVGKGVRIRREDAERLPAPVKAETQPESDDLFKGKPMTADDPLWKIIGIAQSEGPTHGPTDVSENK